MYRLLLASSLFGAILALPAPATAQPAAGGCRMVSFGSVDLINKEKDPTLATGSSRREARASAMVPVEIRCGEVLLIAQEIDQLLPEDRIIARGSVVFQQVGTRITAERGEFDSKTKTGFFEHASGTLQLTDKQIDRSLFGAQEPEAIFVADKIEKTGDHSYRLTNAVFSACVQPTRRWEITASRLSFTVDKYAVMRDAVMRVKDVPVLYLPFFYYPIQQDGRATGFLMPSYGSSSFRGFTLSNAFFWAISRSQDATLYHDWFTSSGQGYGADYRYIRGGSSQGDARVYMIREKATFADDGTLITPGRKSYEVRGNIAQSLPGSIRFQAQADYFTDVTTQQLYQVDLSSFSQRSRYLRAEATAQYGRVRMWVQGERNDLLYGNDSVSSMRYQPRTNVSISQAPVFGTKINFSASFDTTNAVRINDTSKPDTRFAVFRTDGSVSVRAPLSLGSAFSLEAGVNVRQTHWDVSRDAKTGDIVDVPLTRKLVETRLRIRGPNFTRVFNTPRNGFAERYKHVIQPIVTIQKTSAFDRFQEVVQLDGIDLVLGGVTQVNYGISNTLMARVRTGDGPPDIREILSLDLTQTYYTNKLAAQYDQQYQSSFSNLYVYAPPPSNFSPVRATLSFSPSAELGGRFGLEYDTQFRAVRSYNASFHAARERFDVDSSWTKRQVIPGLSGYDDPLRADQFVTFAARLKRPGGGKAIGYSTTFDILRDRMLQQRITGFYNAQCCGVSVDYAVTNLKHLGFRNDKRFSISLSLAGIGSFTNPLGVFGNNGIQR
ncbi:MAG TPA: putative LPS assembly protein LptD [Vicinamibacterales bacterium]|nr:putative LPS assembly protein LptD [Vicinamibacterales bacterium]